MDTHARSLIRITGDDRVSFLQGLLTQDVTKLAEEKTQFAAMLSPQGKILHDMVLIAEPDAILIETQAAYKDALIKRLRLYKLRARVEITEDATPQVPMRPSAPDIPELGRDFLPDQLTALDAGYDLLHAVSFTKGCYVGQEITARMHYKQVVRKGFFLLTPVGGGAARLALLKFEEVGAAKADITHEGARYQAVLPGWMHPRFEQWRTQQG